jgi:hypothetical protein
MRDSTALLSCPWGRTGFWLPWASLGFTRPATNTIHGFSQTFCVQQSAYGLLLSNSISSPGAGDLFSPRLCRVGSYLPLPAEIYFLDPVPSGAMLGHYSMNCWAITERFLTHPDSRRQLGAPGVTSHCRVTDDGWARSGSGHQLGIICGCT